MKGADIIFDKRTMIICDSEVMYAKRLVERMLKEGCFDYRLQIFDSLLEVLDYSRKTKVSVLILGETVLNEKDVKEGLETALREGRIEELYLLTEAMPEAAQKGCHAFYKYQAASVLIRQIKEVLGRKYEAGSVADEHTGIMTIGFFSPMPCIEKTILACFASLLVGQERGGMYINLEKYSGFEEVLLSETDKSMTEAVFYLLREEGIDRETIEGMFEGKDGIWYLPPINRAVEFEGIKGDTFPKCINRLKELVRENGMPQRFIFLEFSGETEGYRELLRLCDRLYFIEREDCISKRAFESFYAECRDYGMVTENVTRSVSVPVVKEFVGNDFRRTSEGKVFESMAEHRLREDGLIAGGFKKQTGQGIRRQGGFK